ncbi:TniB family NTP-binding protein [Pseudomonas moorei]|uniref:TniB family NTP-binding protein n=1 Tax=Pseudomonas moorei TaxID=395599 RepID=UPI0036F3EB69
MKIELNEEIINEKLEELSNCTILYPDYLEAMRLISKCINTTHNRKDPSSAMLIGPTGVGKTRLCQMIEKQFIPPYTTRDSTCKKTISACVYFELPESATIKSLSMVMAQTLGGITNDHQSITTLETLILQRLTTMGVKLIILDDFHHVAEKGQFKTKSSLCSWITKLLNKSGTPFLISGTSGAESTINTVQELSDRFPYRARLKTLSMAGKKSSSILLGVLSALQKEMIRLGELDNYIHLTDPKHYMAIYLATSGNFRNLSNLLHDSFQITLLRGDHTLKISDFAEAADDLAFCCTPNYFRMTAAQLTSCLKENSKRSKK